MSTALIGKVLGKYRIIEKLASGGMSDVYKGLQIGLDREVAIKVLPPALAQDREMVKRFRRESQATAKLSHPNIITIYDSGEQDGVYFYVMEFLKADSLEDVLEVEKPLAVTRALKVGQDILKALVYCHEKGVVHRDLKPRNIKFDQRENAILTDFGLAEDVEGDAGADLFQASAILHEMLTGHAPVPAGKRLQGDLPDDIAALLCKALHDDAGARFQNAKDMLAEIKKIELKLKAKKLTRRTQQISRSSLEAVSVASGSTSGELSTAGSGYAAGSASGFASSLSAMLGTPKDRDGLLKLVLITVPVFVLGLIGVLWLFHRAPEPKLLEQSRDIDATRASISWKTAPTCYSEIEYWPVNASQSKVRTKRSPAAQAEHRHALLDLRSDTTYNFRFLFSNSPDDSGETFASEVFDFSTRPEIQVFNIHVDEYANKVVVTWETNLRTDTALKYGRSEGYEDARANPEQKSETIHSISIEGLDPETTYHYQIVATDPKGRGQPRPSEDLQFRTSKTDETDPATRKEGGLNALTKSYVDKLTRMTPDEREKLKRSIEKFMDPKAELSAADKKLLVETKTSPRKDDDFNNRLQLARAWWTRLKERHVDVDKWGSRARIIQTHYYSNPLAGAKRLDAFLHELSELDK